MAPVGDSLPWYHGVVSGDGSFCTDLDPNKVYIRNV